MRDTRRTAPPAPVPPARHWPAHGAPARPSPLRPGYRSTQLPEAPTGSKRKPDRRSAARVFHLRPGAAVLETVAPDADVTARRRRQPLAPDSDDSERSTGSEPELEGAFARIADRHAAPTKVEARDLLVIGQGSPRRAPPAPPRPTAWRAPAPAGRCARAAPRPRQPRCSPQRPAPRPRPRHRS